MNMKKFYVHRTCPCGEVKGIGTDSYQLFKGIRYAAAKRWEAPEEVTSWEGIYDATAAGPWCFQRRAFIKEKTAVEQFYYNEIVEKETCTFSEDCLYLNIWTPPTGDNLPVVVFIHGGSYETGGGTNPSHDGTSYTDRGVVCVTINYRLNAFASAYGDGITGNFGVQDQACALKWLQCNISAFGGDPNRVTIMGESAGAMSVQHMIFTPLAKGLFSGAVMLSGGGILDECFSIRTPETAIEIWQKVKDAFGVQSLHELKTVDPGKLYCTWKGICDSEPRFAFPAIPVVDGTVIPNDPRTMVKAGEINGVPSILSVLSEDMWPRSLYHTILEWGELTDQAGLPKVYGMYMDRAVPGGDHGAYHGCDVRYAFCSLDRSWRPYEDIDYRIANDMIDFFVALAANGVPAVEGKAEWKPLCGGNRQFMRFGDDACAMCDVPEEHLDEVQKRGKPFPSV